MSSNDYYSNGGSQQGGNYQEGGEQRYGNQSQGRYNEQEQGNYGDQQQGRYNNQGQQGGYNDGGNSNNDFSGAMQHAQQHDNNSGSTNLFESALGFLGGNQQSIANESLNESQAVQAHQAMYNNNNNSGNHSSETVGMGAAMQALKMFTGGQQSSGMSGSGMGAGSVGGGLGQDQFIGMAMGQASKLFDQQNGNGNLASGASKQSAINAAGKMALKMYLGSSGGGSGGLMSMASKFM